MPIVEVKDVGRIQFPDEMTDEEISQRLSEDFGNGPVDGALMRAGKNIVGSALNIAASVPDSVAIIADKIGNTFPSIDEGKSFNELTTHKIAEGIRNLAPKPQGDAPTGAKGFLTEDVPNAIGSVLGIMAGGAAGRIAKLPTWLGGVAAGAMSGGVDGYDDAKAHGADDDTAFKSFLINAGIGTTDEIPIMNWIKKSGTQPLIRRIIEGGSEEALQEFGQQVASNITAGQLYDPDRPWLEGAASASGAGFTVGALFSALTNAILGRRAKQAKNGVKEIADAGAPATAAAVQEIESPIHDGQKVKDNNLIEGVVHDGQVVQDNPNLQLKNPIDVKQGDASVPEVKLETLDKSTQDAISAIESEIAQHQSKVGLDTPIPTQETKPADQPATESAGGPLSEEEKALFQAELDELQQDSEDGAETVAETQQPADVQAPVEQTAPSQTQTESTPQPQTQVQEQAQPQQPEKPAAPQVSTVDDAISQVNEAVKSVDEKLKKHLGQIQIVNLPEGSSGIMSAPRAGQNVILIDPPKLKASLDAGMDLRTAIEEETIHNLTGDALKLMAKEEGNKANQQQYWDEQMGKVADEMTPFEKQWVQEKYGKPLEGPQLGAEFVRMVMQEKLRGDITEANYRRRSKAPTLHKILRNFLRFARKSLGLTLASKSAKQIVGRVETIVRQGRQNDRSQKTMEVGGSNAEVGTRGDQVNQPDPHPPQPSPVTGGNPRVAAEPSIQTETGTGDSGRGELSQADAAPEVEIPEADHIDLYKSIASELEGNKGLTDSEKTEALTYIYSRAKNVAKAWIAKHGSLKNADEKGNHFSIKTLKQNFTNNYVKYRDSQKRGGGERPTSIDAPIGEDGGTTVQDTVAAPESKSPIDSEGMQQMFKDLGPEVERMARLEMDGKPWLKDYAKEKGISYAAARASWLQAKKDMAAYMLENNLLGAANPKDVEYLDAVDRGDMEKAQRMVDEAAKAAGYDSSNPMFHGSDKKFTVFENRGGKVFVLFSTFDVPRQGFFFSGDRDVAKSFGKNVGTYYLSTKSTADLTKLYNRDHKRLVASGVNEKWLTSKQSWELFDEEDGKFFVQQLRDLGYDSAKIDEPAVEGEREQSISTVVLDPNQIKSADPVTYDSNGRVIPISQRFNPKSDDIRGIISEGDLLGAAKPEGEVSAEAKARELTFWQKVSRVAKGHQWGGAGRIMDVANRTKNPKAKKILQNLADAISFSYDMADMTVAALNSPYFKLVNTMDKATLKRAKAEVSQWVAIAQARGTGANPISANQAWQDAMTFRNTVSPEAKKIIDVIRAQGVSKGRIATRLQVHVLDGGKWRLMRDLGERYWPRIISQEIRDIISDPDAPGNRAKFEALLHELVADDPKRFKTTEAAREFLTGAVAKPIQEGDFYAGAEMARGEKLPDRWYDYSIEGLMSHNESFGERIGQIAAFGQNLPGKPDLWRIAEKEATDQVSSDSETGRGLKQTLEIARSEVYGTRAPEFFNKGVKFLTTLATVRYLFSIKTSVRNIAGGLLNTQETFGAINTAIASAKAMHDAGKALFKSVEMGRIIEPELMQQYAEMGAIQRSLYFMRYYSLDLPKMGKLGKTVAALMTPNQMAEMWSRTVAGMASQMWLQGTRVIAQTKPGSNEFLRRKALMQRWGFSQAEITKLLNGDVAMSHKFARLAVKEKLYGYKFDQSPTFFSNGVARFMSQMMKWGAQRNRDLHRNVLIPAVMGEVVDGKKVRTIAPLMRMVIGTSLTAAALKSLFNWMFDKEELDTTWNEIMNTASEDEKRAVVLGMQRIANDFTSQGAAGIIPDQLRNVKDMISGGRRKDFVQPPGMGTVKDIQDLAIATFQRQGDLKGLARDIWQILGRRTPSYREAEDLMLRTIASDTESAQIAKARGKVSLMKNLAQRYAEEFDLEKLQAKKGFTGTKSPNSETYDRMYEALLTGDKDEANALKKEYAKDKKKLEALKRSVQSRNPLGLMASGTQKKARTEFESWLRSRRPDAVADLLDMERTYERTARSVGLLN